MFALYFYFNLSCGGSVRQTTDNDKRFDKIFFIRKVIAVAKGEKMLKTTINGVFQ